MARIGTQSINVSSPSYGSGSYKYGIDIYEDSTNIMANTGYYRIVFSIMPVKSRYSGWTDSDATFRITTSNGQSINADSLLRGSTSAYPNYNQWYTIATWSGTLTHKDDGSLDISVSINYGWNSRYAPTQTTISLTSAASVIPRASDISCNSPIVMGTTQTVTVTQKSTSFSHILYYKTSLGEYVEIGRNTGVLDNTYSWAVPDITASLPSATSDNYTLRVLTYLNETYEGDALESLLTVVATVPASYVPTIKITNVVEGNTNVPSTFPYIVGYSKPKITTRFTGSAGSTCVSRSVNVGNETQTSTSTKQDVQFQMMLSLLATTNIIRATTTDSRGRTGSATQTISAYAYVRPNIQLDCTRCDANGSVNALGNYIKVRAKWNYDSVNNKNSATIKTYQNGTLKNTYTPTSTSSGDWTELVIISASSTQQYTIRLDMTDLLDTASVSQIVSKAVLPLSTFDDGNELGVSFGRMATEEGFRNYMNEYVTSRKSFNLLDTNGRQVLKTISMDDIFEFVNKTTMNTAIQVAVKDVYSTSEVKTNKVWIDGKPIYRKTIYVSSLPNATATNVNHNISNVSSIWADMSFSYVRFSDGSTSPFNYIGGNNSNLNASIELRGVTKTKFTIDTHTTNRSSASAYVTLFYTKK